MKIETQDGIATLGIEEYADLLQVRVLPEWRMTGYRTVTTEIRHLEAVGILKPPETAILGEPSSFLFDYQRWIVGLALQRERFAVFSTTGTGKTAMLLDWARIVTAYHRGRTLIVSPLAIIAQTIEEANRFYGDSLPIADLTDRSDLRKWFQSGSGIGITNFEKIDGMTGVLPVQAVVIDESSALKQSMGSRRTSLIAAFRGVRWKLCCSATPAPNDRIEYAEHAYFLDVVRSTREFLANFFVNRDGQWRLKHHGIQAFYRHLASWSVFMRSPAAYGFSDNTTDLPPLDVEYLSVPLTDEQIVAAQQWESGNQPSLFGATPGGVTSRTKVMQIAHGFELDSGKVKARYPSFKPEFIADLANEKHGEDQVIIWVTYDEEGDQLERLIAGSIHLSGRTQRAKRDAFIEAFRKGNEPRVLILKPSMFGHGLNLQSCHVQIFSTISDSFERFFQCVRRSHRYGQKHSVKVYIPLTQLDNAMCQNVMSKQSVWEEDAERQEKAFVAVLRPKDTTERRVFVTAPQAELDRASGETWTLIHGDCIAHMPTMASDSMDHSVFSPPFANLFTYSAALSDMGNVRSDDEYRLQWEFFVPELFRIMKPGRVVAVHCMDVIRFAGQHGYRYTYDYPSDLRLGMEKAGFIYRARISIDKNPQAQATRTKDQNLLFVTLKRNALDSHPQASECVLLFTKPGEPETPVHADDVSNQEWIEWAHHVWYGIAETNVLNAKLGKEHDDERHICPLQLSLIERCVRLWTNPDETVFSPFAGIGSEGYEALKWGRKFYGVELKRSYFDAACRFLTEQEEKTRTVLQLPI